MNKTAKPGCSIIILKGPLPRISWRSLLGKATKGSKHHKLVNQHHLLSEPHQPLAAHADAYFKADHANRLPKD